MPVCPICQNGARLLPCSACNRQEERREAARAVGDTSFDEAKRMYVDRPEQEQLAAAITAVMDSPEASFCADVLAEVRKARAAFPGNGSLITGLALGEESGEAQRALLHIREGKDGERNLYLECVQTAAMALRLATESEDRREWAGNMAEAVPYLRDGMFKPEVTTGFRLIGERVDNGDKIYLCEACNERKQVKRNTAPGPCKCHRKGCGGSYEIGSGGHVPGTPGEDCADCDRDFGNEEQRAEVKRREGQKYVSPRFARRSD